MPAVKITANERNALNEIDQARRAGRSVNWDKVHGHTRHALERKGLLAPSNGKGPGWQLTNLGKAAIEVPGVFDDLIIAHKAPTPAKVKKPRRPRQYDDIHLATLCEIRVEVTPHIDADEYLMGEVIIVTGKDTRPNGREAELILDEGEATILIGKLEQALANRIARRR